MSKEKMLPNFHPHKLPPVDKLIDVIMPSRGSIVPDLSSCSDRMLKETIELYLDRPMTDDDMKSVTLVHHTFMNDSVILAIQVNFNEVFLGAIEVVSGLEPGYAGVFKSGLRFMATVDFIKVLEERRLKKIQ